MTGAFGHEPALRSFADLQLKDVPTGPTLPDLFRLRSEEMHRPLPPSVPCSKPTGIGNGWGPTMRPPPLTHQNLAGLNTEFKRIRRPGVDEPYCPSLLKDMSSIRIPQGPRAVVGPPTFRSRDPRDASFQHTRIATGDVSPPLNKSTPAAEGSHELMEAMGINIALEAFKVSIAEKTTDYVQKVQTEWAKEKEEMANSHSADLEAACEAFNEGEEEIKWLKKQMAELEAKVKMLELMKK